jgi:threonine dehydratase
MSENPSFAEICEAAQRIAPFINRTPVLTSTTLNRMTGGELYFKCENLQKVGAFKIRGATNAVGKLRLEQLARGVTTHSSGNHAAAVALAAAARGAQAVVVMPRNAPEVKKNAVAGYGATIEFCDPGHESREAMLAAVVSDTGAHFIHPYDDCDVIEGQASAALELMQEVPDLDLIVAPIGGGGLISGTALAVHGASPRTRVVGVEPQGADDALRSVRSGKLTLLDAPRSIADGVLAPLSERTFEIIRHYVGDVVAVSEDQIVQAMRTLWERMKIVVEPSGALPLAALLAGDLDVGGTRVGVIVSGGNVDLESLPW